MDRKDATNHHPDAINRRLYNHQRFIASLALTEQDWFFMAVRLRGRDVQQWVKRHAAFITWNRFT
ncbi:hypothetical protein [Nostoc sp. UHCC 0252]|uniref:hypothetical protein n=1 Tax=Nostoc sp. UHCC 0252 TaxID=3110241 RepID=UPI002B1E92E2|nr:hypothetical protein [Nostoc sp. UHCC 0252]MEA5601988.1 hypothetical protein [Nostoc sp. UHCC 0252]